MRTARFCGSGEEVWSEWGCLVLEVSGLRGVWSEGSGLRGVHGPGRKGLCGPGGRGSGGVYSLGYGTTLPVNTQTPVKSLPSGNFVCWR